MMIFHSYARENHRRDDAKARWQIGRIMGEFSCRRSRKKGFHLGMAKASVLSKKRLNVSYLYMYIYIYVCKYYMYAHIYTYIIYNMTAKSFYHI